MKDFLRGTFGRFLQIIFGLSGIICLIIGLTSCSGIGGNSRPVIGGLLIVLAIILWCMAFGVRYWLGHNVRIRK